MKAILTEQEIRDSLPINNKLGKWDMYYLKMAAYVATNATCTRRSVGAVAVKHNRVIGTGYNGAPSGMVHCTPETCVRKNIPSGQKLDVCKAIHAEANIVLQLGFNLIDSTLYCTTRPCTSCLKLLLGARVERIVWMHDYPDEYSKSLMDEIGIIRSIYYEPYVEQYGKLYYEFIRAYESTAHKMESNNRGI